MKRKEQQLLESCIAL